MRWRLFWGRASPARWFRRWCGRWRDNRRQATAEAGTLRAAIIEQIELLLRERGDQQTQPVELLGIE